MNTATLILQIITIAISITSMLLTILSELRENKKKHYLDTVTQQRISNKNSIRNYSKILLENTHETMLQYVTDENIKVCVAALAGIETVFKNVYKQEKDYLETTNTLISALNVYVDSRSEESKKILLITRELFYKLYSIYDLSDWKFIKRQSSGKSLDSDEFDNIYAETEKTFL